jgi:hypothetical protein
MAVALDGNWYLMPWSNGFGGYAFDKEGLGFRD